MEELIEGLKALHAKAPSDSVFISAISAYLNSNAAKLDISGSKHDIYAAADDLLVAIGEFEDESEDETE